MTQHRVVDNGDLRKYRTETPNVVFALGLSPYEFTLYSYLKRTAGSDGTCFKSTATLAKETGMSSGMVSKAKLRLQADFPLIGKPLIVINEEANKKGGKPKHCITLTDIWPENFRLRGASSLHEVGTLSSSQGEVASSPHERASSPGEIKKEPIKKELNEEGKRDFLSDLKADPLFAHVDFDFQVGLMQRWLARPENKGRRMTERFVLNWLNKIDRPVSLNGNGAAPVEDKVEKQRRIAARMGYSYDG